MYRYITSQMKRIAQYYLNLIWWMRRTRDVITCPDFKHIETVTDAGKIKNGFLIMHNGLKVEPLSYYGAPMLKMLKTSKGIHEPQEERIFADVLTKMPRDATMIELGSYWAFYSMCFNQVVSEPKNFMIEPTDFGLEAGRKNFQINNMTGAFTRAYVGEKSSVSADGTKIICVDNFIEENNIKFIDILHSDIQGFEVDMLEGAKNALINHNIGYIFISTHSNKLHATCTDLLKHYQYKILVSIDLTESFSVDGLLVAVSKNYPQIDHISISRRRSKSTKPSF